MKTLILLGLTMTLTGCNMTPADIYSEPLEFDWMPNDLMWEQNIRNCRSQPQCSASDLFARN